jgi:hypothetical protein
MLTVAMVIDTCLAFDPSARVAFLWLPKQTNFLSPAAIAVHIVSYSSGRQKEVGVLLNR